MADRRRPGAGKRGAGTYSLSAAVLVFLLLLLFAVQLTFNLRARSHVTASSYSAARIVAGYRSNGARAAATAEAEATLRDRLGPLGSQAAVEWDLSRPDVVRVHVAVTVPSVAPARIAAALGLNEIDRTIEVRVEEPQR